jgi:hypothetical protein
MNLNLPSGEKKQENCCVYVLFEAFVFFVLSKIARHFKLSTLSCSIYSQESVVLSVILLTIEQLSLHPSRNLDCVISGENLFFLLLKGSYLVLKFNDV